MRIRFVCKGELSEYIQCPDRSAADMTIFGFNGAGEVSYERELKGETRFFEELATLSKRDSSVVVCGCITNARGHKRRSAAVAENGKLLGVSDMLHVVDGELGSGAMLRIYDTKIGKLGVVVASDLRFPDVVKSLTVCGSDFIVCPYGVADGMQTTLLQAHAYCFGVPMLLGADGYAAIAEPSGALVFASPNSPQIAELSNSKEYHLVETRQRFARA